MQLVAEAAREVEIKSTTSADASGARETTGKLNRTRAGQMDSLVAPGFDKKLARRNITSSPC